MGIRQRLTAPLKRYLDGRFERLHKGLSRADSRMIRRFDRVDRRATRRHQQLRSTTRTLRAESRTILRETRGLRAEIAALRSEKTLSTADAARLEQARYLERIDLSAHNNVGTAPTFDRLVSQTPSAAHFVEPQFVEIATWLEHFPTEEVHTYHRKLWEYVYVVAAVKQSGNLESGKTAAGFGVHAESLPAFFASEGIDVVAADHPGVGGTDDWAAEGISALSRLHLISDEDLAARVTLRNLELGDVPADMAPVDILWSSHVMDRLGSPERGIQFALESSQLLKPGGVAVHLTELELMPQPETRAYETVVIYRIDDFLDLEKRLAELGCRTEFNFHVSMDQPQDRWISMAGTPHGAALLDPEPGVHLKLASYESVSTSIGVFITKDA